MNLLDDTIDARGFAPAAIAVALRTIGSCYAMRFLPDNRPIIGVGLLIVTGEDENWRFDATARILRESEMPDTLLDWLETRMPEGELIVSWHNWGSVPRRLAAIADPERHPRIVAAARDTDGRWRDLPRSMTWHIKQARAQAMPCLCRDGSVGDCTPVLPACLLPDPDVLERELMLEAAQGWMAWANLFGDFDDQTHPARRALRALAERKAWDHKAA